MTTKEIIESIDIPFRKWAYGAFYGGSFITIISQWIAGPWSNIAYLGIILYVGAIVYIGMCMYKAGYKGKGTWFSILGVLSAVIFLYLLYTLFPIRI